MIQVWVISHEPAIHVKNVNILITEILNDLWPPVMNDIFQKRKLLNNNKKTKVSGL